MTCLLCKGEMKPGTTIHTVQLKNCVVVIKNVPCLQRLWWYHGALLANARHIMRMLCGDSVHDHQDPGHSLHSLSLRALWAAI